MKQTAIITVLAFIVATSVYGGAAASDPKPSTPVPASQAKAPDTKTPDAKAVQTKSADGKTADAKATEAAPASPSKPPASWQEVKRLDFYRSEIGYDDLPADDGNEAPYADDEPQENGIAADLKELRRLLPLWAPGKVEDPVQRVRNLILAAVIPDIARTSIEPFAPIAVLEQMEKAVPRDDLLKVLCWIALHPKEGSVAAVDKVEELGFFFNDMGSEEEIRYRTKWYAAKFILRLTN